uniref:Uncharacterized protein n=1 Tax=Triticum urartu TaxID=4572 RepID=A0A8R7TH87_TRIUA
MHGDRLPMWPSRRPRFSRTTTSRPRVHGRGTQEACCRRAPLLLVRGARPGAQSGVHGDSLIPGRRAGGRWRWHSNSSSPSSTQPPSPMPRLPSGLPT